MKDKKNFTRGLDSLLQSTLPSDCSSEPEPKKRGRPRTNTRLITKTSQKGARAGETRATFLIQESYLERLKALSYWKRKQIKALLHEALESYFKTLAPSKIKQAEKAYQQRDRA